MELLARDLECTRTVGTDQVEALRGVSMRLTPGSTTFIHGSEESGNSLLLRILGLLEVTDRGALFLDGNATETFEPATRAGIRAQHFGFVFREPFLLPSFTVAENVAMPLFKILAVNTEEARVRVESLLEAVGIPDLAQSDVDSLTLPEQMRVALARALVNQPHFLLLENIDTTLDGLELQRFVELAHHLSPGAALVASGTSPEFFACMQRVIEMADGRIIKDSCPEPL